MELKAVFANPAEAAADWLIVPVWQDQPLPGEAAQVNERAANLLGRLKESRDFAGKANEVTALLAVPGLAAKRLLILGLGELPRASLHGLNNAAATASRAITGKEYQSLGLALPE